MWWPFSLIFGKKATPAETDKQRKQRLTLESLARRDIPVEAQERIMRQVSQGNGFFTSDLTAREHLVALHNGLKPLGQVMGTSFYQVSYRGQWQGRWNSTGELVDVTRAQVDARKLALERLRKEAKLMGASGVVAVRIKTNQRSWGNYLTEFTAVGTAVKIQGWPEGKEPFICALSAQEFYQLRAAGYVPEDVAMGVCSYYMYTDYATQNIVNRYYSGRNQEVPLYTQGFYTARNLAQSRLTAEVKSHNAEGVVGMVVDHHMEHVEYEVSNTRYHDLIAHIFTLGTSVRKDPTLAAQTIPSPKMVLSMKRPDKSSFQMMRLQRIERPE